MEFIGCSWNRAEGRPSLDGSADGKAEATPSECFFVQELCECKGGGAADDEGRRGMRPPSQPGSPCNSCAALHPCAAVPAGLGGSLGDLVRKQMIHNGVRRLYSDADALRWSIQVAQALMYLHESRPVVIHRDLKARCACHACCACCSAAGRAHDAGRRVHSRPLLPSLFAPLLQLENVMLTSEDVGRADAKLGDFGLARLTPPGEKQKMDRL